MPTNGKSERQDLWKQWCLEHAWQGPRSQLSDDDQVIYKTVVYGNYPIRKDYELATVEAFKVGRLTLFRHEEIVDLLWRKLAILRSGLLPLDEPGWKDELFRQGLDPPRTCQWPTIKDYRDVKDRFEKTRKTSIHLDQQQSEPGFSPNLPQFDERSQEEFLEDESYENLFDRFVRTGSQQTNSESTVNQLRSSILEYEAVDDQAGKTSLEVNQKPGSRLHSPPIDEGESFEDYLDRLLRERPRETEDDQLTECGSSHGEEPPDTVHDLPSAGLRIEGLESLSAHLESYLYLRA
ncbi:hypothetical protein MIND_01001400 [Mycena indigotica]|uniref:Uncharacterized protein n=1 Tax=Mycena indigotica TaxID=2126181 RepID=A0A8H6VUQ7_9AGAR|nr:uncharacterized protein MIND_01001400 [Mycena indigotica]KAF7294647.1 hypothetical protein MIND_01001400 [Mycena indigotica]